jgi:alpha-methylacyl-CoA racemase
MAIGPIEPQFYAELLAKLDLTDHPDLPGQHDVKEWGVLRDRIADAFASHTQAHWIEVFDGSDACVSPVRSMTEAPRDPHLLARGTFIEGVYGPEPGPAPRFSGTPAARVDGSAETREAFGLEPLVATEATPASGLPLFGS